MELDLETTIRRLPNLSHLLLTQELIGDLKYIQGSGGLMTIFTEVGLLGIIITLFILVKSLAKKDLKQPLYVSFAILALGFSLLPLSPSFYIIIFLLLALNSDAKDGKLAFFIKRYAISLFSVPVILSLVVVAYLFWKSLLC